MIDGARVAARRYNLELNKMKKQCA
jgi:hypothetical protein